MVLDNSGGAYPGSNLDVSSDPITISTSSTFSETITIQFTTDFQVFETAAITISVGPDCSEDLSLVTGATLTHNLIEGDPQ